MRFASACALSLLLAAPAMADDSETMDPAAEAELAEQMEVLQDWLADNIDTLEDVAAGFEAVEDDDPAQLGAAWSRALTVNARELSWYRVEDPILLAARLALEMDALGQLIAAAPDGVGASYSIGYDFNTGSQTHTGPDGEPSDPPDPGEDIPDGEDAPESSFCPNGEMDSGERGTPRGPLKWRTCQERDDADGYVFVSAIQLLAGDDDNGSLAMVAIAVASDDAGIRESMAEPARRIVQIMGAALTLAPADE